MRILLVAGIALAVLCGNAWAQMYRWVDKDGRTHYTQTPPPPDAKRVQKKSLGAGSGAVPYGELPFATQSAAKNYPVTLYTTPDCGKPCEQARALLVRRVVPFKEISVQQQKDVENLKAVAGGTQVPFLIVGSQRQTGFLEEAYIALLDSAGYPASGLQMPIEALRHVEAPTKPAEPGEGGASDGDATK
jgi:glutaredoxin